MSRYHSQVIKCDAFIIVFMSVHTVTSSMTSRIPIHILIIDWSVAIDSYVQEHFK